MARGFFAALMPLVYAVSNAMTETSNRGITRVQRAVGSWEDSLAPGANPLPSAGRNGVYRASCPADWPPSQGLNEAAASMRR